MNNIIANHGVKAAGLALILMAGTLAPADCSAALTVKASHNHITVGQFYHGSTVTVEGASPVGSELILKISGADEELALKKKGKVGGMMWMNVAGLEFEHTPYFYMLTSSKDGVDLAPEEAERNMIGYSALNRHVSIPKHEDGADKAQLMDELIKYKEHQHLYSKTKGQFNLEEKNGEQMYSTVIDWPYQAKPGDYTVEVLAVKDGKVIDKAETSIEVEQVGTVKSLVSLAKNHGAMYGLLSVLVALASGVGVSLVFKKGGGAH